jgi:hypothetical protein
MSLATKFFVENKLRKIVKIKKLKIMENLSPYVRLRAVTMSLCSSGVTITEYTASYMTRLKSPGSQDPKHAEVQHEMAVNSSTAFPLTADPDLSH